jgi:hypothetical protein
MINAPKPVHINLSLDASSGAGDVSGIYTYETVPDATVALKVTVPGMGAGGATTWTGGSGDSSTGSRSPGRKASWIWLRNMDAADDVGVSFDNGNNFITIKNAIAASNTYDTFSADIAFRHFYIKALTNTADVECIVGINGPN